MKLTENQGGVGRFFGSLMLLGTGLVGLDVLAGLAWADVAAFDVQSVLVGLGIFAAGAGILSVTVLRLGPRVPRWYRWIFGLGMGVLVPFKLGLNHPASGLAAFALTTLVVVGVSRVLENGRPRVLAVVFLLLLAPGGGWFDGLAGSVLGEMTLSGLSGLVLGVLLVVLYRMPKVVTGFVDRRAWLVSGLLVGLFLTGMAAWWIMKPRKQVPSYFSGTVPEVEGPSGIPTREMPNVILISVDTLRADRVPPLAEEDLRVPSIRSLMEESVRFRRLYSPSSWTLPSHASLFTGLDPMAHGAVTQSGSRIYSPVPSYVQMLRDVGYQTAAFTGGGYMSAEYGFGRGFERYWTNLNGEPRSSRFRPGLLEWGNEFVSVLYDSSRPIPPGTKPEEYRYFWENLRAARSWLSDERDPGRPFFLFLHTYQAHDYSKLYPRSIRRLREQNPELAGAATGMGGTGSDLITLNLERKERLYDRLRSVEGTRIGTSFAAIVRQSSPVGNVLLSWVLGVSDPHWARFRELTTEQQQNILYRVAQGARRWGVPAIVNLRTDYSRTSYHEWLGTTLDLKPETLRTIRARNRRKLDGFEWLYDDLVEDVDRSLGDFLEHLRARGLYDDTLIVFLSDHGEGFSWSPQVYKHGMRRHTDGRGQLDTVLTRVPLSIKPPVDSPSPSGGVCEERYQLQDVFPIVFRELGVRLSDNASRGKVDPSGEGPRFCPHSRRNLVRGSVSQRKAWLEFRPRFYVQKEDFRLEVQREPVKMRSYWELVDGQPDRRVPVDTVPETSREELQEAMEEYLRRFDEHPDPFQRRDWEADEELEAELRGLGYF